MEGYRKRETLVNECFVFLPQGEGYIVKATRKPDLRCFSLLEINEMRRLVETYAHRFAKAADAGKTGRKAPGFWKRAWGIGSDADIGHDDVFDDFSHHT